MLKLAKTQGPDLLSEIRLFCSGRSQGLCLRHCCMNLLYHLVCLKLHILLPLNRSGIEKGLPEISITEVSWLSRTSLLVSVPKCQSCSSFRLHRDHLVVLMLLCKIKVFDYLRQRTAMQPFNWDRDMVNAVLCVSINGCPSGVVAHMTLCGCREAKLPRMKRLSEELGVARGGKI